MLRDPSLIPLSHQHQHALALCVAIGRALQQPTNDAQQEELQARIQQAFESEIFLHFVAEERVLFPAASKFPSLRQMVQDLLIDHQVLRTYAGNAIERKLGRESLLAFSERLTAHVRKEESELFEELQKCLSSSELKQLGKALDACLAGPHSS